ncbi:MAG: SDR family oxidoreductase [Bdellovibrionota bacterium]
MDLKIKGKRALVQGGSSGLGRAIAAALVAEGVKVAIASRDEAKLRATAREIGAAATVVCDLSKPGQGEASVREAIEQLGGIDILICNTGGPPKGPFEELTDEQWQQGFQSLWLSAVDSIRAALSGMKLQEWGRIMLVTSAAAREPMAGLNISNGLRAGLLGLTKSVSNEIASFGVTINALLPGYTNTERLQELGIPTEKITAHIPARRLGKPEELGAVAAFLASEHAAYVSGQAIAVDGGYLRGI